MPQQSNLVLSNENGAQFRADLNNALLALAEMQQGNTAPVTTYPFMLWADTSTTPATLRIRTADNTAWHQFGPLDTDYLGAAMLAVANTFTAAQKINAPNGFTGHILELIVGAVSQFNVDQAGNLTTAGQLQSYAPAGFASNLLNLLVGGTSKFNVDQNGNMNAAGTASVAAATGNGHAVNLGQFPATIGNNGKINIPYNGGSLILQWGQSTGLTCAANAAFTSGAQAFPFAFPNACLMCLVIGMTGSNDCFLTPYQWSGTSFYFSGFNGGAAISNGSIIFIAIGH